MCFRMGLTVQYPNPSLAGRSPSVSSPSVSSPPWAGFDFPLQKLKGPDFGLVSRPLLPGTFKLIIWGNDDNTVLTILALMPRPS